MWWFASNAGKVDIMKGGMLAGHLTHQRAVFNAAVATRFQPGKTRSVKRPCVELVENDWMVACESCLEEYARSGKGRRTISGSARKKDKVLGIGMDAHLSIKSVSTGGGCFGDRALSPSTVSLPMWMRFISFCCPRIKGCGGNSADGTVPKDSESARKTATGELKNARWLKSKRHL